MTHPLLSRPAFTLPSRRDVATMLIGGAIAALLNLVPVAPYYGVALHLGSVIVMALAIVLGAPIGAAAAAISFLPSIARSGDPLPVLFAIASVAVVGMAAKRRVAPIVATLVFVAIAGPPMFILLKYIGERPAVSSRAVITGLVLDVVVGAMSADLLRSLAPVRAFVAQGGMSARVPLRVHLFRAFAIVSALPLLISGVVAGRAYARRLETDAERRLNDEAASLSAAIDDYVVMHRETLGRLATTIERERRLFPGANAAEPLAEYHAAHGDFLTLFVTDRDGRIVASHHRTTGSATDLVGTSVSNRAYFQNVMALDAPYISSVIRTHELGDEPVVGISTPIHDASGHVVGIVEGSIDPSHFARLEPIVARIPASSLLILDDSSRVVFTSANANAKRRAVLDTANMSDRLVGSATSRSGWRVMLTQPLALVRLDAEAFFDTLMLATIAAIALSFVVASMLARRVTTPIEQLASEARRFGERGEPIEEVSVSQNGPREVATLVEDVRTLTVDVVVALAKHDRANRDLSELLTHLDELVQERTQELERATMRAEDASEAKSRFLATMSHELRTPMHGVIGMLRLLDGDNLTDEQRSHLAVVRHSADALLQLLNDLLDYSKIEAGKLTLESMDFEPVSLARDVVKLMSAKASQRGITLSMSLGDALPTRVSGDAARTRQILLNLVDNAVKFTERGSVELRLESSYDSEDGNAISFAVADTGIGMSAEQARRIFQPFTQADESTTRRFGGTGLGLAICRDLVSMMGGQLTVDTAPGRGSKFRFTLRYAAASGVEQIVEQKPASVTVATGRVLVVDDHVINRLVAEATLTNYGCTVRTAMSGEEALDILANEPIDLVFMDCRMPEMDGFEATRLLRLQEQARGRRTPVVALTAGASAAERENCKAADMDDFLAKPLAEDELVRVLNQWLGNSFDALSSKRQESSAPAPCPGAIDRELLDSLQVVFGTETNEFEVFINTVRNTLATDLPELAALVHAGDLPAAALLAHRVAGVSMQAGASRLGKMLIAAEQDARSGDHASVAARIAAAMDESNRVLDALAGYLVPPAQAVAA